MTMPIGAPDASWGHILTVTPDANGTRVQNLTFGEDTGREIVLDGRWQLPTIGRDPVPAGRSLDDSTFALVGADGAGYGTAGGISRFAILRAALSPGDGPLTLVRTIELKGAFAFDALSPNGSILYVVQQLDAATGHYQVRSIPVATGVMRRCGRGRQAEHRRDDGRRPDHPAATGRRDRHDALPRAGAPVHP